jgi:hypothetical protein
MRSANRKFFLVLIVLIPDCGYSLFLGLKFWFMSRIILKANNLGATFPEIFGGIRNPAAAMGALAAGVLIRGVYQ